MNQSVEFIATEPMEERQLYYHPATGLFLDTKKGIMKYDAITGSFVLKRRIGKQALRVLTCLLNHDDMVVTRCTLLTEAWSGRIVSDNYIYVTVSRLRMELTAITPLYGSSLITKRNAGYIFSSSSAGLVVLSH